MKLIGDMLLGMLPEVVYFYVFIKNILKINNKKVLLFIAVLVIYLITIMLEGYNLYLYITFYILLYIALKLFKKINITDFFLIIYLEIYLFITSCVCYYLIPNYIVAYIVNRISLFLPLLIKNKLINLYGKYKKYWNRNEKAPIKSLTLRNISILFINFLIIGLYVILSILSSK